MVAIATQWNWQCIQHTGSFPISICLNARMKEKEGEKKRERRIVAEAIRQLLYYNHHVYLLVIYNIVP